MNKTKLAKLLGLIGAIATAAASAVAGDFVQAGGILSAALASSSVFSK